jgi:hypothetical protein
MSESDTSYEVETILDKTIKKDIIYYKIKWKGYSYEECTWEPSNHLSSNCDRLINEYEERARRKMIGKKKRNSTKARKKTKKNSKNHLDMFINKENQNDDKLNYFSNQKQSNKDDYIEQMYQQFRLFNKKRRTVSNPMLRKKKGIILSNNIPLLSRKNGLIRKKNRSCSKRTINFNDYSTKKVKQKNQNFCGFGYFEKIKGKSSNVKYENGVIEMTDSENENELTPTQVQKIEDRLEIPKEKNTFLDSYLMKKKSEHVGRRQNYNSMLKSKSRFQKTAPYFPKSPSPSPSIENPSPHVFNQSQLKTKKYYQESGLEEKKKSHKSKSSPKVKSKEMTNLSIIKVIETTPFHKIQKELIKQFSPKELSEFGYNHISSMLIEKKYQYERMKRKDHEKRRNVREYEKSISPLKIMKSAAREEFVNKKERENIYSQKEIKDKEREIKKKKIMNIEKSIIRMLENDRRQKEQKIEEMTERASVQIISDSPGMSIPNEIPRMSVNAGVKDHERGDQNGIKRNKVLIQEPKDKEEFFKMNNYEQEIAKILENDPSKQEFANIIKMDSEEEKGQMKEAVKENKVIETDLCIAKRYNEEETQNKKESMIKNMNSSQMIEISSNTKSEVMIESQSMDEEEIKNQIRIISRNLKMNRMFVIDRKKEKAKIEKESEKKSITVDESLINQNSPKKMELGKRNFTDFHLDKKEEKTKNEKLEKQSKMQGFMNINPILKKKENTESSEDNKDLSKRVLRKRKKGVSANTNLKKVKMKDATTDCMDLNSSIYRNFILRHTDDIEIISNIILEKKVYIKIKRRVKDENGNSNDEILFLPSNTIKKIRPDLLCTYFEHHLKIL